MHIKISKGYLGRFYMVSWYYVVGSDRVGPVSLEALKQLFSDEEINLETYVWKKGFPNWERLKDVSELKFNEDFSVPESEFVLPTKQEERSPEVNFTFSWNSVRESEELFFIKIGKDRKNASGSNDIFGPYSLVEIKEALTEKRINLQTLIFTPGMTSWTKIQETPINGSYKSIAGHGIGLSEVPLILVFDSSPLPLITVVKKAGVKDGVLLGAGPFTEFQDRTVKASLYVGNEIKARDVQVRIQGYDKKNQSMTCQFVELSQDAKKIMLNHAV